MNMNQSPPSQGSAQGSAPGFAFGAPEYEDFLPTDPTPPRGAQISFAYNVPDAFESDQEVVRSEMMFYNTPLTEKYSEQVYGVVKNVQAQCSADVQRICPKSAPYMSLNKLMAQLMMPMEDQRIYRGRRLMSAPLKTGADYVNYVRSFYSPLRLIKHAHPLSAAVHLDEKTGNLVGHGKKDKDAMATSHVHRNQPVGEGRLAAPGWKMPTDKPPKPTEAEILQKQMRTTQNSVAEAIVAASNAAPRSHAVAAPAHGHHHNHGRRNLRLAAPGWVPPSPSAPSPAAAGGVPAEVRSVLDRAETAPSLDVVGPVDGGKAPCAKPFQPPAPFFTLDRFFAPQTQQSEEPLIPELTETVPSFGTSTGPAFADFRSFVLDFLSGRDVSLSLTLPYTVVLDSNHEGSLYLDADVQQGEDGADYDGYYSYYANDEAGADLGVGYYDDDGANYAYDDATGLDDDGEEADGAEGAAEGGDDDDFFAQRFDLLPPGRKVAPSQAQTQSDDQPQLIECGGAAGGPTQMVRRPLVQPRARARSNILTVLGGRRGPSSSEEGEGEDQRRSPSEEGPGGVGSSSSEEDGDRPGHRDHDRDRHGHPKPAGRLGRPAPRPHGQVGPAGPPPGRPGDRPDDRPRPPRPPRGPPGGPGSSEDEEDGHHDRHHHHGRHDGPPPPPPHPPVPEDHSFSGNLGFGADGDMCLYRGLAQGRVSPPCQAAVGELYQLRAEYWEESQQQDDFHHHHGGLGLLIIGLVLLVCCVRRFYAARYEKKVRSLLTALHTHPHLKASVEAETGLEIPAPVPAGTCCVGASTEGSSSCDKSLLVRAGKMAAFASLVFAVSFAVSYSALEVTMRIVNEMDKHAEETEDPYTGETHYTSPLAALFILFMVCVAELTVVALVVRGVKALVMRRRARQAFQAGIYGGDASGSAPSAPLEGSSWHGGRSAGGRGGLSQSAQQVWMSLPTASLNLFGRGRRSGGSGSPRGGDGYAVLLTEEDREEAFLGRSSHGHGTEMVSVSNNSMSAYPAMYTAHSAAPAAPQQQAVQYAYLPAGPVTARPVNAVSMV